MPPRPNRKTAPRVVGGRVLRKNNWQLSRADYHAWTQEEIRIDRRSPGEGFRHLLTVAQLRRFLALLPDWEEMTVGLDAIVLDAGRKDVMGWHRPGVVAIRAWEQDLWWDDVDATWVEETARLLELLGVERVERADRLELHWTEAQARAFQLLDVLPHELGHHHDRMTTHDQRRATRGEPYALKYALEVLERVWPRYAVHFDV